jgi:hypothetical protein
MPDNDYNAIQGHSIGDLTTSLVNTRIALSEAPEAARKLCRRLIDSGFIEEGLSGDIPRCMAFGFQVRSGYTVFDAALAAKYRPCIYGIEIKVTGHDWRNGVDDRASLVKAAKGSNGLFFNFDGSEPLDKALDAWCADPETALMECPTCERATPARDWRSASNTFAAGHLAVRLWGGHITTLTEKPPIATATNIRRLIGDFADDFAVVYCMH